MNNETSDIDNALRRLEEKVDALTTYCKRLSEENQVLKGRIEEWSRERAQLVEKSAIAKTRVEAMISRLKSIGHEP